MAVPSYRPSPNWHQIPASCQWVFQVIYIYLYCSANSKPIPLKVWNSGWVEFPSKTHDHIFFCLCGFQPEEGSITPFDKLIPQQPLLRSLCSRVAITPSSASFRMCPSFCFCWTCIQPCMDCLHRSSLCWQLSPSVLRPVQAFAVDLSGRTGWSTLGRYGVLEGVSTFIQKASSFLTDWTERWNVFEKM